MAATISGRYSTREKPQEWPGALADAIRQHQLLVRAPVQPVRVLQLNLVVFSIHQEHRVEELRHVVADVLGDGKHATAKFEQLTSVHSRAAPPPPPAKITA
jgi:hypothetical protein